jgi:hypothetical protein
VAQDAAAIRSLSSLHDQRVVADVFGVRLLASGGLAVAVETVWRLLNDNASFFPR